MPQLNIKIILEEDGLPIAKAETFDFENAEMELGSLERLYEKMQKKRREEAEKEELEGQV